MKVAEQASAVVPLPERKPAALGGDSDSTGFGTTLAEVQERLLPGRKPTPPEPILPGRKPDAPVQTIADGILPGVKPQAPATTADRIKLASRQVANLSGHSFAAILSQATQESNLDASSRSRTSSAAGPFQFLERTWLGLVKRYGSAYGLGELADQIDNKNGLASCKNPEVRKKILDLRYDVDLSAGMAARYLAEGRERLSRNLGRPVSESESRIAYVMGVGGAAKLLRAAQSGDETPAADLLPAAAKANGPLFYDRSSGRALSATETVSRLTRHMETSQRELFAAIDRAAEKPVVLDGAPSPLSSFQSV